MRILIDYRPALRERTGVGEYVHQLTTALVRQIGSAGAITLFSSSWKDRLGADRLPGAKRLDARIPVRVLNLAWHRLEWPPVEMLGGLADVTWSLHPLLMPARRAAQVVTIHDLFFLDRPDAAVREIRRDYGVLAENHARRADAVIVNSEYTRQSVVELLRVDPARITVCYPGSPPWTPRVPPTTAGPILHVGTTEPRKNIGTLLRAYALLARSRDTTPPLLFAGRVIGKPADLVAQHRVDASRVHFLGYVSPNTKQQLYHDASMLVIPSLDEGFGMPAVEAMAMGVPVVAADRGALPEVLGDAGLLNDVRDAEHLAAAMARVLDDPELRATLVRRGVERSKLFNWEESASRLLAAFHGAVQRRMKRR